MSKTTLRELTKRYRQILIHCFLLNALSFSISVGASAAVYNANKFGNLTTADTSLQYYLRLADADSMRTINLEKDLWADSNLAAVNSGVTDLTLQSTAGNFYILEGHPFGVDNTYVDGLLFGGTGKKLTLKDIELQSFYRASGGAVNIGGSATLTLDNTILDNNTATNGGGIYLNGVGLSTVSINNKTKLTNNSATTSGGVLYATGGSYTFDVNEITVETNQANNGGAFYLAPIAAADNTLTIQESTFSTNKALSNGGVAYLSGGKYGIDATDSTFSGNTAVLNGGGYLWNSSFAI